MSAPIDPWIALLRRSSSAAEAGQQLGLTEAQAQLFADFHRASLAQLAAERRRATHRNIARATVVALAAGLVGSGVAVAASGACPNGYPFCFAPDQPARASEVNHNFSQIKEWLETKVGSTSSPNVTIANNATITGTLGVANSATVSGTLGVTSGATVGGTAALNGNLTVGGTSRLGPSGRSFANMRFGTHGTCGDNVSVAQSGSFDVGMPVNASAVVLLTPGEYDNNGCTTARVVLASGTSVTYNSWHDAALQACDCIHWVVINP